MQSKWDSNGTATIGLGDSRNFVAGFKDLTDERFDRFNDKIARQKDLISEALGDPSVRFVLVVATTGASTLNPVVQNVFDDTLEELNNPIPLVDFQVLGLTEFHALVSEGLDGGSVDLSATVEHWGTVTEPYEAFYGVVDAKTVGDWYARYGDKLFAQNIRGSLGATGVNNDLRDTLTRGPEHFWYFNNGITVLCQKIEKSARGATTRNYGKFSLFGASVVNGAQTVASIHRALKDSEAAENARVWIRFISLEACPPEFAKEVTRATNTQNSVEASDFVALDPEQARLRVEMLLSCSKIYAIKRGDQPPDQATGCTVYEATVALACAYPDPSLAVLAKSAVGRLWESTERAPYKSLFNSGVSAFRIWRTVDVLRSVDSVLNRLRYRKEGREKSIVVQGNRIVAHLVFHMLDMSKVDDPDLDWSKILDTVPKFTLSIVKMLTERVESMYANNYITSLFKNASRCKDLVGKITKQLEALQ
ncbi:AIPR family protein [Amycolatopsis sp. CA-161197]|uniref:AIPR family protein n=1 Tax=Amycolatopsis sp. CA-161197 TaxID=3239922 RepID=UPI003D901F22